MRYQPDELFRSTAPYYARYRAGYPPAFFEYLRSRFDLDGSQRVLDLGCGTGQIAVPLAPSVIQVIAVDPEPTMLEEAAKIASERGIGNINWRQGDSYRLADLDLHALDLVTMGASFHWMDRDQVLHELDSLVTRQGSVVIVSGGSPGTSTPPPWADVIAEVRARFLGSERRAGSTTYSHPPERHADVLARSPFSQVDIADWTWHAERDLDQVVGLQFSYSFSAPALFADRRNEFETELRAALTDANPSGLFTEEMRTEAIAATRP